VAPAAIQDSRQCSNAKYWIIRREYLDEATQAVRKDRAAEAEQDTRAPDPQAAHALSAPPSLYFSPTSYTVVPSLNPLIEIENQFGGTMWVDPHRYIR
jgi:hypothetical protein